MDITRIAAQGYEDVLRIEDARVGLVGFIALHSTALGPAAGGLRMRPYPSEDAALTDALRLAKGMTLKNAAAGLPLGGGKAVVIGDPDRHKNSALLAAIGRSVDSLGGRYWTAEDMGMTPADMAEIATQTPFVAGRPDGPYSSGDPSPVTARGILAALHVTAQKRFGSETLEGLRVAVQGLGHVGRHLCALLHEAGACLTVSDLNQEAVAAVQARFGARVVATDSILAASADILAPCAVGGILNSDSIPNLRVGAIAGGANNQLATPEDGERLHQNGILYAPDFIANAGGIINVATEILRVPDRGPWVDRKLHAARQTLSQILNRAAEEDASPNDVAETHVEQLLRAGPSAHAAE
ncbi:MAG: Glu/Leu/Phe/Val dehydrogenase dimerization domain-containing protein [Pseudomonadota bacterium]